MSNLIKSLSVLSVVALCAANPVTAQETGASADEPATTQETPSTDSENLELNLGEEVTPENQIGRSYTASTHGDWAIRCIRAQDGNDPCQLYQLLKDQNGNSVSEISMFALPPGQQAVAGATIAVPLETLLTQQLTITVDGGQSRRYPFTWCSAGGCFARVGFSAADIATFKRGAKGTMTIVPVGAPDARVVLNISLSGFTAGFDAVSALGPRTE